MVKLAQKKTSDEKNAANSSDAPRNNHGISGRGNVLRDTAVIALLLVLVPALVSIAYLFLLRAPSQKSNLLDHLALSYATQQAHAVAGEIAQLRERLQSATRSPLAMSSLVDNAGDSQASAERRLLHYFPEANSLRLIPLGELGTAELEAGLQGLRNNIEIDLVRRVSNGEEAEPEAYLFEGEWMASLAQAASHPEFPSRRAVLLLTISADALQSLLEFADEMPGKFTLEQEVFGNAGAEFRAITSLGNAPGDSRQAADVANTPWRIAFSPSQALLERTTGNVLPDFDLIGLLLVCSLGAVGLMLFRTRKALTEETDRITAAAEHRTQLEVRIPQLIPLARDLRVLSLRRHRSGTASASAGTGKVAKVSPQEPTTYSEPVTAVSGPAVEELPEGIFRAYDIRGIAESELTDDTVYRIGSAIATIAGEMGEQTLALGYDGRLSSRRIKEVLEKSLLQSGRDVIDIGLVPTPLLYFATSQLDATSGVMITGSHNPADYNGMKIVLKGKTVAQGTIEKIRKLAQEGRFSRGTGRQIQQDVSADYMDEIISDIAIAVPLKVVVDAGNGAAGVIAPTLLEELGCDVIPLYCEVDGSFPNRSPDTSNEDNLADLVREVLANDADFGVAYDGDGDRVVVVTGSGRIIRTDTLMMVFARDVVSRNPGADVVYDVKCSRNLAALITKLGGRPVLWKTGHAYMKQKMLETGALLGGEFSGHIFFGERWYGFDDGIYTTGRLAEILSSVEESLDDFVADLPQDVSTPEILIPVPDDEKFALIERFVEQAHFPDGKSNSLDGLRVDFADGWGLLRASNTGPALTARFEAKDDATLASIQQLFREQLNSVAPELPVEF